MTAHDLTGSAPKALGAPPLSPKEFAELFEPLLDPGTRSLAVAVSGGADSLALLHVMDAWARRHTISLLVLTVDHGLRVGSADEALTVGRFAVARGWRHRTLSWHGAKPVSGLSEAARDARYRLLLETCHAEGITALVLAHHLDDQAETVLYRMERDSGPDGLAGMARVIERDGVRLLRPLLGLPKARLIATCRAAGLLFADDPTNSDQRYARPRLRALMPELSASGVTAERLGRLADAMGSVRARIDQAVCGWVMVHVEVSATGWIGFEVTALETIPDALRAPLIERLLRWIGGGGYPPRGDRLNRLVHWLGESTGEGARTLAGCHIERMGQRIVILREWQAVAPPFIVPPGQAGVWDGRYEVRNDGVAPVRVGVCGHEGWRRWRRSMAKWAYEARRFATIPHRARLALPMVVDLDGGIALPHLTGDAGHATAWVGQTVRLRFRPMDVFWGPRPVRCGIAA